MDERLERARDALDSARDITDDSTTEEQLASMREALETIDDEDETPDAQRGDRLEEVERQLTTLGEDLEGLAVDHLETARDALDEFRRESAREWEASGE